MNLDIQGEMYVSVKCYRLIKLNSLKANLYTVLSLILAQSKIVLEHFSFPQLGLQLNLLKEK